MGKGETVLKLASIGGLAAGSMLGIALGASMMTMPQGKRMKRAIDKSSAVMKKQMNALLGK